MARIAAAGCVSDPERKLRFFFHGHTSRPPQTELRRRRILPRVSAKLSMSRLPGRTTAFIVLRSNMLNSPGRSRDLGSERHVYDCADNLPTFSQLLSRDEVPHEKADAHEARSTNG